MRHGYATRPLDSVATTLNFSWECGSQGRGETERWETVSPVCEPRGPPGSILERILIFCTTQNESDGNGDDHDDGDEETDDEGISQPLKSQKSVGAEDVPAQSEATKKEWGDTPVKLLKMDVGDHKILRIDHSSKTVMVQCGRFESTLRITRVSLRIGFSRVKGSTSKVLISKLHMVGAVEDEYPAAATNYLVTSERSGHAKQLIAWC